MNDKKDVLDSGPFFHGTKAELKIGHLLEPQHLSVFGNQKVDHFDNEIVDHLESHA